MNEIYIVVCELGSYADYQMFNMGAFSSKERAEEVCAKLQFTAREEDEERFSVKACAFNDDDIGWKEEEED